jgi:DNA mismatch endonuclease (patch repair protein)
MTDVYSRRKRSEIMSRVKNKNTAPELFVRSALHRMGYRFRLQGSGLPGNPDIVLPRHKKVVLVHGCFWHGHSGCGRGERPSTNTRFWRAKIATNMARDKRVVNQLRRTGWGVLTVWQCQTTRNGSVQRRLRKFLKTRGGLID